MLVHGSNRDRALAHRFGLESILKLISYRYGLGYLNKRHRYAQNIGVNALAALPLGTDAGGGRLAAAGAEINGGFSAHGLT